MFLNQIKPFFLFLFLAVNSLVSTSAYGNKQPECKTEPKELLVLTKSELREMNVLYDSSGVTCTRINGYNHGRFSLSIYDDLTISYTSTFKGFDKKKMVNAEPAVIVDCQGNVIYDKDESYSNPKPPVTKGLIAVKVPHLPTGGYLIFWFPNNKDVKGLLPEKAQLALKANKNSYELDFRRLTKDWRIPTQKMEEEDAAKLFAEINKPEELTKIFSAPNLFPIDDLKKELSLTISKKGFELKHKNLVIAYDNGLRRNGAQVSPFDQSSVQYSEELLPLFFTIEGDRSPFYGVAGLSTGTTSHRLGTSFFGSLWELERRRLVGFIDESVPGRRLVFWYAYSPAIQKLLSPEQRAQAEGYLRWDFSINDSREEVEIFSLMHLKTEESIFNEPYAVPALDPSKYDLLGIHFDSLGHVCFPFKKGMLAYNLSVGPYSIRIKEDLLNGTPPSVSSEIGSFFANNLVCITDERGMGPRMINGQVGEGLDWDKLVPVRISSPNEFKLVDQCFAWSPGVIFWFTPESKVLEKLKTGSKDNWIDKSTSIEMTNVELDLWIPVSQNGYKPRYRLALSWKSSGKSPVSLRFYNSEGMEIYFEHIDKIKGNNKVSLPVELFATGFYTMVATNGAGDKHIIHIMMPYDAWR